MLLLLGAAIIFGVVLYWDVISDFKKWKKHIPVKHTKEGIIRSLLLIPSVLLLSFPDFTVLKCLVAIVLEIFLYLVLFDGFYNKERDLGWWDLGSEDEDDAITDKIQRKINPTVLKILKIGIPVLLLITYIIIK